VLASPSTYRHLTSHSAFRLVASIGMSLLHQTLLYVRCIKRQTVETERTSNNQESNILFRLYE
jgi:hypothetical protein